MGKFQEVYESVIAEAKVAAAKFTEKELEMAEEYSSGDDSEANGMGTDNDDTVIDIQVSGGGTRKIKKIGKEFEVSGRTFGKKTFPTLKRALVQACKT